MRRRLRFFIFIIIVLGIVVSNNQFEQNLKVDAKNVVALNQMMSVLKNNYKDQEYDIMKPSLSLAKRYRNIEALEKDSDLIVEGKAKSTKTILMEDVPLTISEIEVYEVYKTDDNTITKGSTICMGENGGILSKEYLVEEYKKKFGTEPKDVENIKLTKVMPDGIAPMEPGDHVLMFAMSTPELPDEGCYFVLGAYQGKYNVYDERVEHQVPKGVETLFEDKVTDKKELIDLIKKSLKNQG